MSDYTKEERARLKAMTLEQAEAEAGNAIYLAALVFERLELAGKVRGNGHHMAQDLAERAKALVRERWIGGGK